VVISKVLGTEDLHKYLKKYKLKLDPHFDNTLGTYPKKDWKKYIS